ncbi:hypothetical protein MTP99_018856 [Tenebrio molitor]|jgi:hypothetical protein|nr:hypothetical protein MTP99_018856 [Tenebrio molitor]
MWVPGEWQTEDDVEKDLLLMAEHNVPRLDSSSTLTNQVPVPESILKHRRLIEKNRQSVLNSDIDESAIYVVKGRGKGIHDRLILPGGIIESNPVDEIELKKKIRQVAGLGYSNELIKQSIKAKHNDPKENSTSTSSLKWVSTSSSASSSKSSTENSPSRKKDSCASSSDDCKLTEEHFPPLK